MVGAEQAIGHFIEPMACVAGSSLFRGTLQSFYSMSQNQRLVYSILFRTAAETLLQIAADPRHLSSWRAKRLPAG
jgi:hypothetical protein